MPLIKLCLRILVYVHVVAQLSFNKGDLTKNRIGNRNQGPYLRVYMLRKRIAKYPNRQTGTKVAYATCGKQAPQDTTAKARLDMYGAISD